MKIPSQAILTRSKGQKYFYQPNKFPAGRAARVLEQLQCRDVSIDFLQYHRLHEYWGAHLRGSFLQI